MTNRSNTVAGERLKSFIERIEKLEEERAALGADIREVYSEAKGSGFDVTPLRIVIKRRKMEPAARNELDEVVDIYEQAVNGRPVLQEARQKRDDQVRALLGQGKSVRQIEKLTQVPKSEVQRIRAELAGEIRKDVSQTLGQQEPTPSPTPMEATGGVAHKAAIGTRDGAAQAGSVSPQSQQPPEKSDNEPDLSQTLGQSQEAATDSDAELSQDLGQGIEAEVPQVAVPALGRLVLTSGDRLGRGLASLDPGPIPDFLVRAEPAKSEPAKSEAP